MNFLKLHQIYLPVSNLAKSKNWFMDHFNVRESTVSVAQDNKTVELCFDNTSFHLVEQTILNRYTHIPFNFHTNRIRQYHTAMKSSGVMVTDITKDFECFDFYDLDGNRLGFCMDGNESDEASTEIGGTFLSVRDLSKTVQWYEEKLDYEFSYFSATGGAGVAWPTLAFRPDITIHYAGVNPNSFKMKSCGLTFVQTPTFTPLSYKPYSILSDNIENDHETLRLRGVQVSDIAGTRRQKRFDFYDLDRNLIGIVQE